MAAKLLNLFCSFLIWTLISSGSSPSVMVCSFISFISFRVLLETTVASSPSITHHLCYIAVFSHSFSNFGLHFLSVYQLVMALLPVFTYCIGIILKREPLTKDLLSIGFCFCIVLEFFSEISLAGYFVFFIAVMFNGSMQAEAAEHEEQEGESLNCKQQERSHASELRQGSTKLT